MSITKDRRVLIWGLVVNGLLGVAPGCVRNDRQRSGAETDSLVAGPKPSKQLMFLAISAAYRNRAVDPAGFDDLQVNEPTIDHLDGVPCWLVTCSYQARKGLGGWAIHHGAFWLRQGQVLRVNWG